MFFSELGVFAFNNWFSNSELIIMFVSELGVFAKRPIYKFTQFGPFVGELVSNETLLTNSSIPIMVSYFVSHRRQTCAEQIKD